MEREVNLLEIVSHEIPEMEPRLEALLESNQALLEKHPLVVKSDIARVVRRIHRIEAMNGLDLSKEEGKNVKKNILKQLKIKEKNKWESREQSIELVKDYLSKYFFFDVQNLPEKDSSHFERVRQNILNPPNSWTKILQDCGIGSIISNCVGGAGEKKNKPFFKDIQELIQECLGYFLEEGDFGGLHWETKEECIENGSILFGEHFGFDSSNLPEKDSVEFQEVLKNIHRESSWRRLSRDLGGSGISYVLAHKDFFKNIKEWVFGCLEYFLEDISALKIITAEEKKDISSKEKCIVEGGKVFGKYFNFNPQNLPARDSEEFERIKKEIYETTGWRRLINRLGMQGITKRIGNERKDQRTFFYKYMSEWLYDCLQYFVDSKDVFEVDEQSWKSHEIRIQNAQDAFARVGFRFDGNDDENMQKIEGTTRWDILGKEIKIDSIRNYMGVGGERRNQKVYDKMKEFLSDVFTLPPYFFESFGRHLIREALSSAACGDMNKFFGMDSETIKGVLESNLPRRVQSYNISFQEKILNLVKNDIGFLVDYKELDPLFEKHRLDFLFQRSEKKIFSDEIYNKKETPFIENYKRHDRATQPSITNDLLKEELSEVMFLLLQDKGNAFREVLDDFLKGKIDITHPQIQQLITEAKGKINIEY